MLESMNHRRLRVSRRRCTALLSSFRLREWPPSSIFFFQAQGEEASIKGTDNRAHPELTSSVAGSGCLMSHALEASGTVTRGMFALGQGFVQECDIIFDEKLAPGVRSPASSSFNASSLVQTGRTPPPSSPIPSPMRTRGLRHMSLEQQDKCLARLSTLLPHLENLAAVRSAQGIQDLIDSCALPRLVDTLRLANACFSARRVQARVVAALAVEALCSTSACANGTQELLQSGAIDAVADCIQLADKSREAELIECGSCMLGNMLSHANSLPESNDKNGSRDSDSELSSARRKAVVDTVIAADAHLALVSIVADGR